MLSVVREQPASGTVTSVLLQALAQHERWLRYWDYCRHLMAISVIHYWLSLCSIGVRFPVTCDSWYWCTWQTWVPELFSSEKRPTSAKFRSHWLFLRRRRIPRCLLKFGGVASNSASRRKYRALIIRQSILLTGCKLHFYQFISIFWNFITIFSF